MAEGTLVAEGTAANGTPVKVYNERGLMVARDEAGSRLTHSDTLKGLKGAGFKLEEVKTKQTPEPTPEPETEGDAEPEPETEVKDNPETGSDQGGLPRGESNPETK